MKSDNYLKPTFFIVLIGLMPSVKLIRQDWCYINTWTQNVRNKESETHLEVSIWQRMTVQCVVNICTSGRIHTADADISQIETFCNILWQKEQGNSARSSTGRKSWATPKSKCRLKHAVRTKQSASTIFLWVLLTSIGHLLPKSLIWWILLFCFHDT